MYPTSQISYGQSGAEVTKLQNFLIGQGMSIPAGPTGYFGDQTKQALLQWQQKVGVQAPAADLGSNWGPKSMEKASLVNSNVAPTPVPTNTATPYNASIAPPTDTTIPYNASIAPASTGISSSSAQPGMIRPPGGGPEKPNPLHDTIYGGTTPEQAAALKAYGVSAGQWNDNVGSIFSRNWLQQAIAQSSSSAQQPPATPAPTAPRTLTDIPGLQGGQPLSGGQVSAPTQPTPQARTLTSIPGLQGGEPLN